MEPRDEDYWTHEMIDEPDLDEAAWRKAYAPDPDCLHWKWWFRHPIHNIRRGARNFWDELQNPKNPPHRLW